MKKNISRISVVISVDNEDGSWETKNLKSGVLDPQEAIEFIKKVVEDIAMGNLK